MRILMGVIFEKALSNVMRKVSLFSIKEERPPKSILKPLSKPPPEKEREEEKTALRSGKTPSTIYSVVAAKNASKTIKEKSLDVMVQRRKRGDWGEYELAHAWSPDDIADEDGHSSRNTESRIEREETSASDFFVNMPRPCIMKPIKPFQEYKAKAIIKEVLEENLENKKYDHLLCKQITVQLSDQLKERVKRLRYPRYKYVCHVIVGDVKNQDVRVASRGMWDSSVDSYAMYEYKNFSLYAVGIVFAVYCE